VPIFAIQKLSDKMDTLKPIQVNQLIRSRRSVFPASYIDKPIPKSVIEEILENANWAPNHRHTEPWRFKVFQGAALERLGAFLSEAYKSMVSSEKFSPMKYKKTKKKPLQSACVIAICMQRDPSESLPEWEELAAVACAVQNMWLTCTANKIGAYWSSPKTIHQASEFLGLSEGESCIGFFYMGYYEQEIPQQTRKPISDKVVWLNS